MPKQVTLRRRTFHPTPPWVLDGALRRVSGNAALPRYLTAPLHPMAKPQAHPENDKELKGLLYDQDQHAQLEQAADRRNSIKPSKEVTFEAEVADDVASRQNYTKAVPRTTTREQSKWRKGKYSSHNASNSMANPVWTPPVSQAPYHPQFTPWNAVEPLLPHHPQVTPWNIDDTPSNVSLTYHGSNQQHNILPSRFEQQPAGLLSLPPQGRFSLPPPPNGFYPSTNLLSSHPFFDQPQHTTMATVNNSLNQLSLGAVSGSSSISTFPASKGDGRPIDSRTRSRAATNDSGRIPPLSKNAAGNTAGLTKAQAKEHLKARLALQGEGKLQLAPKGAEQFSKGQIKEYRKVQSKLGEEEKYQEALQLLAEGKPTNEQLEKLITKRQPPVAKKSFSPPARKKIHLPPPKVTAEYLRIAQQPNVQLDEPQQLLVILDLNGTLVYRPKSAQGYPTKQIKLRPFLKSFLRYLFEHHKVVLWSSAAPQNVQRMAAECLTREQQKQVLLVWGRDTLEIPDHLYKSKVVTYKRLNRIWEELGRKGDLTWDQSNTILIDDSKEKAMSHPYNHVEIPDFTEEAVESGADDALAAVSGFLEEASMQSNVSSYMREAPFVYTKGLWTAPWETELDLSRFEEPECLKTERIFGVKGT